mmetsp:Transcript_25297/g.59680  ORF Transcript_25297/g.59680 Transcript_25297/m.59680 type:complete len:375 (-) Transcript_25297:1306-2430(-)
MADGPLGRPRDGVDALHGGSLASGRCTEVGDEDGNNVVAVCWRESHCLVEGDLKSLGGGLDRCCVTGGERIVHRGSLDNDRNDLCVYETEIHQRGLQISRLRRRVQRRSHGVGDGRGWRDNVGVDLEDCGTKTPGPEGANCDVEIVIDNHVARCHCWIVGGQGNTFFEESLFAFIEGTGGEALDFGLKGYGSCHHGSRSCRGRCRGCGCWSRCRGCCRGRSRGCGCGRSRRGACRGLRGGHYRGNGGGIGYSCLNGGLNGCCSGSCFCGGCFCGCFCGGGFCGGGLSFSSRVVDAPKLSVACAQGRGSAVGMENKGMISPRRQGSRIVNALQRQHGRARLRPRLAELVVRVTADAQHGVLQREEEVVVGGGRHS